MFDQIKYVRYIVHKASCLNVQCIQGEDTESDRDFVNMNEVQKSSCVLDFFPLSSSRPVFSGHFFEKSCINSVKCWMTLFDFSNTLSDVLDSKQTVTYLEER